mgnify:FL=1|tara:strand:+ start:610 stop:1368 length:759 start_codon:yes stop_codon:yes gene_type:complete
MSDFDHFRVERIAATEQPQKLIYTAFNTLTTDSFLPEHKQEDEYGRLFIDHWKESKKQRKQITNEAYAPLNHPSLTLQIRANRSTIDSLSQIMCRAVAFDCQSLQETADNYRKVVSDKMHPIEDCFYSRNAGRYSIKGEVFEWTEEDKNMQLAAAFSSIIDYNNIRNKGIPVEVAKESISQNLLINATVTASLRDWLLLLERALRLHRTYEDKALLDLIGDQVRKFCPEIFAWWYEGFDSIRARKKQEALAS